MGFNTSFVRAGSEDGGIFRPQLTSLVDILTIMLVFLIKSFSVEGDIVTQSADLTLPVSTSAISPKRVTSIEVTREAVVSDRGPIVSLDEFKNSDSLLIPRLFQWVLLQRQLIPDSLQSVPFMIKADKDIDFNIVKRVMFTCSKAGFTDFSVLVTQDD
jgi:biopolymer transport protein ExbD